MPASTDPKVLLLPAAAIILRDQFGDGITMSWVAGMALSLVILLTALFAVVAADPRVVARKLRFALRMSFLIGIPGMAVLILGAHLALGLFGKGYTVATLPMWLITLALLAVRHGEAVATTPPVARAAFGHGRHRRALAITTRMAASRR